jgi:hypothetical protein
MAIIIVRISLSGRMLRIGINPNHVIAAIPFVAGKLKATGEEVVRTALTLTYSILSANGRLLSERDVHGHRLIVDADLDELHDLINRTSLLDDLVDPLSLEE